MSNLKDALHIPDTQSARDEHHLAIQRVGVRGVRYPMQLRLGATELATVAEWDLDVALPAEQKGTHISRFIDVLGFGAYVVAAPGPHRASRVERAGT